MPLQPPLQPVKPGDLINSAYINDLLHALETVEARVKQLEEGSSSQQVLISEVLPSSIIRSGEELTVVGRNFEVPVTLNTVTIGSQRISTFNDASATSLIFNVPNVASTRTQVDLVVRNNNGRASYQLTVDPPAPRIPRGELHITENFDGLGVIRVGQTYIYLFQVISATDIDEAYRFGVSFSNAEGASVADWAANALLVTPGDVALPVTLRLEHEVEQQIGVRIRIPDGATRVTMTLSARSQNSRTDPLLNKNRPVVIQIDEEQPVSSDTINFGAPLVFGSGRLAADGAVEVPIGGGQTRIQNEVGFEVGGDYTITAPFEPADVAGLWLAEAPNPSTTTEDDNGDQQINVRIRSLAPDPVTERFLVVRIESTRTNTGESIVAWTRIRLRSF